jgi:hypothetical protein
MHVLDIYVHGGENSTDLPYAFSARLLVINSPDDHVVTPVFSRSCQLPPTKDRGLVAALPAGFSHGSSGATLQPSGCVRAIDCTPERASLVRRYFAPHCGRHPSSARKTYIRSLSRFGSLSRSGRT